MTISTSRHELPVSPPAADPRSHSSAGAAGRTRLRRQINHDIHHELSTIMLLASLLSSADDIGPDSRQRAEQIVGETRWLQRLFRAFEDSVSDQGTPEASPLEAPPPGAPSLEAPPLEPTRLDMIATEVVAAAQLSTRTRIDVRAREAWARVDRLAFWRALRNLVDNAIRAAGPPGTVRVLVGTVGPWTAVQVDDSGPGFGAMPPGPVSLGLGIVEDLATGSGGGLDIASGALGGCRVLIQLPSSPPTADRSGW